MYKKSACNFLYRIRLANKKSFCRPVLFFDLSLVGSNNLNRVVQTPRKVYNPCYLAIVQFVFCDNREEIGKCPENEAFL